MKTLTGYRKIKRLIRLAIMSMVMVTSVNFFTVSGYAQMVNTKDETQDNGYTLEEMNAVLKVKFEKIITTLADISDRISNMEVQLAKIQSSLNDVSENVSYVKDSPEEKVQLEFR